MPVRVVPARGLADLRTLAGLADRQTPAYKAFLRISFLELERARHDQEIATAQRRLAFLVARCREIDAEKSEILASSAMARPLAEAADAPRARRRDQPTKQGFRFAY